MRMAVVGARGQLGAAVVAELSITHDVRAFDRASLDVTDGEAVLAALAAACPDAIVNCSGYSRSHAPRPRAARPWSISAAISSSTAPSPAR
jgi:dTDP-4-dehydrorhamnose reductase